MDVFGSVLRALEADGIRYVVVGGVAVNLHGFLRLTGDLDLVIDLTPDEARRTMATLERIGLRPRIPVSLADFADPVKRKSWIDEKGMLVLNLWDPNEPLRTIDIFVSDPIAFDGLYDRSVLMQDGGFVARVASIDDLLTLKRMAGRPEDLRDIEALEDILEERRDG